MSSTAISAIEFQDTEYGLVHAMSIRNTARAPQNLEARRNLEPRGLEPRGEGVMVPRTTNVLVVEDQPLLRFLAADMLSEAGYGSILAANAEEAMEILAQHDDVSLVFSDINMDGEMTGLDLAHEIKARWPHIGVVLASGGEEVRAGDMPARSVFIPKPYRWEDVLDSLERVTH